jgi:RND family efflux transporter MFP subunit
MKRSIPRTLAFLPTAVVAFALVGCGSKHENENSASLPTAQVRVETIENKSRTMTEEVVGTVRAKLRATLEARLSGRIEKMPVTVGDPVQKGQLLARLDAGEIAARLEQAEASLEEAGRDWKRVSALFDQQSATRAEYDSAQSRLRVAKGAVAEAKAMMSYVEIMAPFDGVVTKKWADVGDLAAPGKPLLEMEETGGLRLEADVPEAVIGRLTLGDKLGVRVSGVSNELEGVVSEIAPSADSNSRTFLVKFDLLATAGLRAGQFGRVAVPVGETSALHAPASAVVQRGQMELVFVVVNGRAQLRIIKTGKRIGDEVELVSGVDAGEQVVVDGAGNVVDGQPLTLKP